MAREQLDKLQQGSRHINEYIADFRRLRTQLSDMGEADALHAFLRGLRRDIAVELRKQRVQAVADAIELAAHVGSIAAGAAASMTQGRSIHANQMDIDDGEGNAGRLDRIEAALNALSSNGGTGAGARTQMQRGYQQERGVGGAAAPEAVEAGALEAGRRWARPTSPACLPRWWSSAAPRGSASAVAAASTRAGSARMPPLLRSRETKRPGARAAFAAQSAAEAGARPSRIQRASQTQRQ